MSKSAIGKIIDSPIEEVKAHLETLNMTGLLNFKKSIELQYNKVEMTKEQLIIGLKNNMFKGKDKKVAKTTLDDLYKVLQKLEDVATIIEVLKKERAIDFN